MAAWPTFPLPSQCRPDERLGDGRPSLKFLLFSRDPRNADVRRRHTVAGIYYEQRDELPFITAHTRNSVGTCQPISFDSRAYPNTVARRLRVQFDTFIHKCEHILSRTEWKAGFDHLSGLFRQKETLRWSTQLDFNRRSTFADSVFPRWLVPPQ